MNKINVQLYSSGEIFINDDEHIFNKNFDKRTMLGKYSIINTNTRQNCNVEITTPSPNLLEVLDIPQNTKGIIKTRELILNINTSKNSLTFTKFIHILLKVLILSIRPDGRMLSIIYTDTKYASIKYKLLKHLGFEEINLVRDLTGAYAKDNDIDIVLMKSNTNDIKTMRKTMSEEQELQ